MKRAVLRCGILAVACLALLGGFARMTAAQDATPAGDCPATSEQENVALVERWMDAWDSGDSAAFEELLAEDHSHAWAIGADTSSADEHMAQFEQFIGAFSDYEVTVNAVHAAGDVVVARWTASGTPERPLFGVEPTGETVSWTGINIFRIECGKIAETWSEMDTLGLLRQLGVPAVSATPSD